VPTTNDLWGGSLRSVAFDPTAWVLSLDVEVTENGATSRYILRMDGVSELHLSRDVPLPWTYAELTEIDVTEVEDGFFVEMILWSDDTSVMVQCAELRVDQVG